MSLSKSVSQVPSGIKLATIFVLVASILILYAPATKLTFFGDDYLFLEVAGRLSFWQYLAFYFDPRVQTAWYRPMQGMRYGIIYALFGANPAAYHWVNVLVHIANCLLLFAIIWRVSRRWKVAMLATLIYSGLPLYNITVFWPGVADFVMTLFYLSSTLFWILYLQKSQHSFLLWSLIYFVLALLTKELAVTVPITLFVVDRLLLRDRSNLQTLAKRYLPYLLILVAYLPMEYSIQSRGVFVNTYGYGFGGPLLSNLLEYSAIFVFPWCLPTPWNYVWLGGALFLFGCLVIGKKNLALLGLAGIGVITFLPVIPFPWFLTRYLYVPMMIFAILLALWFEFVRVRGKQANWYLSVFSAAIALLTIGHGLSLNDAAADFAEIARQSRVPFRDIIQRHPQFPNDTYLYFINPPSPTAEYSGMFFLRYGPGVSVSSNETAGSIANLRAHQNSYVIYFDDQQRTREISIEKELQLRTLLQLPISFGESLLLENYELANAHSKRDEAIALVLYFKRSGISPQSFLASLVLNDASGKLISSREEQLRGNEDPNTLITLPLIISIPPDAQIGSDFRLELVLMDANRQRLGNILSFAPLSITE